MKLVYFIRVVVAQKSTCNYYLRAYMFSFFSTMFNAVCFCSILRLSPN